MISMSRTRVSRSTSSVRYHLSILLSLSMYLSPFLIYPYLSCLYASDLPADETMERDRFMSAEEALQFGLVDEILPYADKRSRRRADAAKS